MHRLLSKALVYAGEIEFALARTATLRDGLRLATRTLQFHVHNRRAVESNGQDRFGVTLRLGDVPLPLLLRTYGGDLFVLYEVLKQQPYFIPDAELPADAVRTIVDCGANIGLTSIYLAQRYPQARIFSIEPHPQNFELLRSNVASLPQITPIQACVVGRQSSPQFISVDRPAWGNSVNSDGQGVAVRGITLAELMKEHGFDYIDLLKVDIEGGEEQLFAAPDFLDRTRYIIIELHGDYDLLRFQHDVQGHGLIARAPEEALGLSMVTARRESAG